MKSSDVVKLFLVSVGVLAILGLVLPWLISAASTAMVAFGVLILLGLILWAILYAIKLFTKEEKSTSTDTVKDEKKV